MKKNLIWLLLILLVFIGIFYWYKTQNKKEGNVIKIGAILALTGKNSVVGEGEKNGLLMALDSLNKGKKKYELLIEDYASDVKNATTAANKLTSIEKVKYIISSSTAVAEAISPIIENSKTIHFCISPDIEIVNKSKFNYRIYYSLKTEAKVINEYLKTNNIKTISFLSINYSSYIRLIDEIVNNLDIGIENKGKELFDIKKDNFRDEILKIKSYNSEAIFLGPMPNQIEKLVQQVQESSINSKIIGSFSFNWKPKTYLALLKGYSIVTPSFEEIKGSSEYSNIYKKEYNQVPNFDAMYSYDNLMIMSHLIEKSGDNTQRFEDEFNKLGVVNGASGEIRFIGNRDTDVSAFIKQY